jgi:parallel beta-helix repeat protein
MNRPLATLIAFLISIGAQTSFAQNASPIPGESLPGILQGEGTSFTVTDSEYLNVNVTSTVPIELRIESVPNMVALHVRPTDVAPSTSLTIEGLLPSTTYYLKTDTAQESTPITTDASGAYTLAVGLDDFHYVFILPQPSTYLILDYPGGYHCQQIGTWDAATLTCTLNQDLSDGIRVLSAGITIDGNGHRILAASSGAGVEIGRDLDGVSVRNLEIRNATYAVYDFLNTNTSVENVQAYGAVFGFYTCRCVGCTYQDVYSSGQTAYGVYLGCNTTETQILDSTFEDSGPHGYGIYVSESDSNHLEGNLTRRVARAGIELGYGADGNVLVGNTSTHNRSGFIVFFANQNTIHDNTVSDNLYGMEIQYSNDCSIYNNNFIDSTYSEQVNIYSSNNVSFWRPLPVGGNYWSHFSGPDANGDGISDAPYVFARGSDEYPWLAQDGWVVPPNLAPVADAGEDQSVHVGSVVTLDGSGSFDQDANYPLTYAWEFVSVPEGSTAVLSGADTAAPTFATDWIGDYIVSLVVTDSGAAVSESDQVLVSTYNTPPVADAGEDQAIIVIGSTVQLDGTQSYDVDGDDFVYAWSFAAVPLGSTATLSDPTSPTPSFVADVHGDYVVRLSVEDEFGAQSEVDTVSVSFENVAPVADPGGNQSSVVGYEVACDGSGSHDANGDPLGFHWDLVSVPEGSLAVISSVDTVATTITPDLPGSYILSLVVNDGFEDSLAANVTIEVISSQDAASLALMETQDTINHVVPPEALKNKNLANALTNKLNAALAMMEDGRYQEAYDKLTNDVLAKTDGCAVSGAADRNDWIEACTEQAVVYPLVLQAIEYVGNLL